MPVSLAFNENVGDTIPADTPHVIDQTVRKAHDID
jgi:hypothetical protein